MNVTIYDVAREANVSMATVSRVVNGNQNVKPATKKKVLDTIERLGYRPNAVARGLASKKTTTVGVIIPDISNMYYAELARGIEDIANMYDYNIILSNSDENFDKEVHLIQTMAGKQVDGLLFMGAHITEKHKEKFKELRAPVVLASSIDESGELPSVNIDYKQAAHDVAEYFLNKGHERMAVVLGSLNEPINSNYKLVGVNEAFEARGLTFDYKYLYEGDYSYELGIEAFKSFMELPKSERPTAILVGGDEMALGVVHAAMDNKINVPNDLEVISFEDTKLAKMVRPRLSSVVQPLYDIGAVGMRLLTKYMNKEEVAEHIVKLPHRIEYRESVK